MIVTDVNILAYYVIEGERSAEVQRLWSIDNEWMVPVFWRVEFQSVLWKYSRLQGMPLNHAANLYEQALHLFSENERHLSDDAALREAIASGISIYDAQYVALARQLKVPCVSLDKPLQKACPDQVLSINQYIEARSRGQSIREAPVTYQIKQQQKKRAAK
ncbi:MAG TPA: type II toxin-antitoxin system VapC family toxin [Kiritimatiellia bacterium]|nr:type II toxin-antitoxin system VapC family toxin [Kiritimatiellia bacterium]